MDRRALLAALTGALSGCAGLGLGADQGDSATVTPAPVPTDSETQPVTGQSRFAGVACPRIDERTDVTVCSHTQPEDAGVRFEPDRPVVQRADGALADPLQIRLTWTLPGSLTVFAGSWRLLEQRPTGWETRERPGGRYPIVDLDAGDTFDWVVGGDPTALGPTAVAVEGPDGPGRYALVVRAVGGEARLVTECVALFDVVG